jgi:hypothetical protein
MPWARIDDSFHDNPKIVELLEEDGGVAAVGLWLLCLTYCHRHTRRKAADLRGIVPHVQPRRMIGQGWQPLADLLVKHKLWELVDGGWKIHDFDDPAYMPDDQLRAARAEIGRRGGQRSGQVRRAQRTNLLLEGSKLLPDGTKELPEGSNTGSKHRSTQEARAGLGKGSSKDSPSVDTSVGGRAVRHGTRIPDDFKPTADMVKWARERCPNVDGRRETEKFINYWTAKSGQAATKLDWVRTWQNWMLSAAERQPGALPSGPSVRVSEEHMMRR